MGETKTGSIRSVRTDAFAGSESGIENDYMADIRRVFVIKPKHHKVMIDFYTLQLFSLCLSAKRYCLLIWA
jgi:hypothetical protein